MDYLKSFIIGSSLPVVAPFYFAVLNIPERNFSYEYYTFIAPLFFGITNAISLYVAKLLGLSLRERLFLTGLITAIFVSVYITINKSYDFKTESRWYQQYLGLFIFHGIAFNIAIYFLEKNI